MASVKQSRLSSWPLLVLLCCGWLLLPLRAVAQNGSDGNTYTTPERLFYITRSLNKNLVCYDYRLTDGKLDKKDPIHVYWVNREEKIGEKEDINFFQRKMAYGYNVINKGNNEVEVKLTAYRKRSMKVKRHNGKWMCVVNINNRPCQLKEIQVKTKEGNPMHVLYIHLLGTALSDGSAQKEKIVNS